MSRTTVAKDWKEWVLYLLIFRKPTSFLDHPGVTILGSGRGNLLLGYEAWFHMPTQTAKIVFSIGPKKAKYLSAIK